MLAVAYEQGFEFSTLLSNTSILVCSFLACLSSAMVPVYISELHAKMQSCLDSSVKLLNGMHEGLLILSNTKMMDSSGQNNTNRAVVMLCNSQAKELISTYLADDDC